MATHNLAVSLDTVVSTPSPAKPSAEAPTLTPARSAVARPEENAWSDLALTLPVFVAYHLGVVFLPTRNAADMLTQRLLSLCDHSMMTYAGLTTGLGIAFVGVLLMLGKRDSLRWQRFVTVALEAVVYAVVLRLVAGTVVGQLRLAGGSSLTLGPFSAVVMSLGAGFYEELVFRVGIYGLGGTVLALALLPSPTRAKQLLFWIGWAFFAAALFSGWHHVGEFGEPFTLSAFVFRWVSGLVFTAIFAVRGFAPVVWTHLLYDIWVLVF